MIIRAQPAWYGFPGVTGITIYALQESGAFYELLGSILRDGLCDWIFVLSNDWRIATFEYTLEDLLDAAPIPEGPILLDVYRRGGVEAFKAAATALLQ